MLMRFRDLLARRKCGCPPKRCNKTLLPSLFVFTLGVMAVTEHASAQTTPDAGALLRQNQRDMNPSQAPSLVHPLHKSVAPESAPTPGEDALSFIVDAFHFTGANLVSEEELNRVVKPWLHRELHFSDLEQVSDAISDAYRQHGWFVRVVIPEQDIDHQIVTLQLLEAKFGTARVMGNAEHTRFRSQALVDIVTVRQHTGDYIDLNSLERASNLLNDFPGVTAGLSLAPGKSTGLTDIIITAEDKPLLSGFLQADNDGSRSTGTNRVNGSLSIDNLRGSGDQIGINTISTRGSEYGSLRYSTPLFSDGLQLGAQWSTMTYRLIGDFSSLNASGKAQTAGVFLSYPFLKSANRSATWNVAFDHKVYNNIANQQTISDKRVHELTLGLSTVFSAIDGGYVLLNSNVYLGRLDLSGDKANEAADVTGPHTQGSFGKVGGNIVYLQPLPHNMNVSLSANTQLALKNLDSSEKLSIGGKQGVTAYPSLEGAADTGYVLVAEFSKEWRPGLQTSFAYDYASVFINQHANYPGASVPNHYSLSGIAAGVNLNKARRYQFSANIGRKLGSNPAANPNTGADSDGTTGHTRYWLSGSLYF